MRPVSCAAAVIGGALLLVRVIVDGPEVLRWIGLGLLAVTALCGGLLLVAIAPVWLKVIVGLGAMALAGGVVGALYVELTQTRVDVGVGVVAILVYAWLAIRWSRNRPERQHPVASHRA